MAQSAADLVDQYDIDAEVVEALLVRYGDPFDDTEPAALSVAENAVRDLLEAEGDHPIRTSSDHFYQFERSTQAEQSDTPATEADFEDVLQALVEKGVVARTDEDTPRYSTSYYDVLSALGGAFTASEIDELCDATGMPKREVYYHVFTDLELDVDLTA